MPPLPAPTSPPLHVLAFDSSTERLSVALHTPGGALHRVADGGAVASTTLLPHIHALLAQAGIGLQALDSIAFGRGPGAFTGLRTACAVAQGLGFGLGRPLLPVDSLLIVAEDARLQLGSGGDGDDGGADGSADRSAALDIGVAMDARMDEIYAGCYRWHGGRWHVLQAAVLCGVPALADAWAGLPLNAVAGSALAAFGDRLPLPLLPRAARHIAQEHNRAAALLRLAVQAAAAGEGIAAAAALPLYLRDKVAFTTRERDERKRLAALLLPPAAATAAAQP